MGFWKRSGIVESYMNNIEPDDSLTKIFSTDNIYKDIMFICPVCQSECVKLNGIQLVKDSFYVLHMIGECNHKWFIELTSIHGLTYLGFTIDESIDYKTYIQSDIWKQKSKEAKARAGYRCQLCNNGDDILDTHHRTYKRLGNELNEDLIVLCRTCHRKFHDK